MWAELLALVAMSGGAPASAPSLIGASAFLTRSARQETVRVEAESVVASACGSRQDTRQDATEDASVASAVLLASAGDRRSVSGGLGVPAATLGSASRRSVSGAPWNACAAA